MGLQLPPKSIINPNHNHALFPNCPRCVSFIYRLPAACPLIRTPTRPHLLKVWDANEEEDFGVKVALSMLSFYKNEISPLMPKSCRYIPTCSEYSMIAYKKYGVAKGSILTAWRICRCNPLGGSGFDPPRWFDEPSPPEQ
ncbi:putative membrane protein insertion efficiency factor [Helianthus annuus]|nr:putative membrane protein insertion efficiency factor [Helianthus annuus]